jgi:uncharacterized protein (TIGR03067 family)
MIAMTSLCLSLGLLASVDLPGGEANAKAVIEKVQGTWSYVTLEVDGVKVGEEILKDARIVVTGDTFTTSGLTPTYRGILRFDASRTPRTLDLIFTEGPEKGNTCLGIYELDGDLWKVCLAVNGKERPSTFGTTPASGLALEVLKREAANPAPDALAVETARLAGEWSMVSGEFDGQALPETFVRSGKRVARGTEVTASFADQVYLKATFTVDPAQKPRSIDYTVIEGTNKGQTLHGIYELDGDTFRSCFAPAGKDRPTEFATKAGDGRTLTAWKRKTDSPTKRTRP